MFGLFTPRWTRQETLFFLVMLGLVLGLGMSGAAREALCFDRERLAAGEAWRVFTANFVHLGQGHLWLDSTGLFLLMLFFRDVFSPLDWLLAIVTGALCVGLGLTFLNPEVIRYFGISGVLHTLLFAGLLLSFRHNPVINGVVFAAMVVRLWNEQSPGYDIHYMQSLIGGPVMVDAHLYGALASLPVVALLWRRSQHRQARFRAADSGAAV